ncbi:conserved hypothetical protein [Paraburkholderia tropica]|uniref:type VI lipase adapter Tla3 domain-containing protein n=1 Tax=Paraburkholderia tropica TaxID=92647 RepID=UPI001CB01A67|nr:DUF2875 family protein [Paraburkholderia tropica]CAG9202459.1 conserved hypothetical protein [Paraburkholderia tropica]
MKLRIWPYVAAFIVLSIIWTAYVTAGHYSYWRETGQEMPGMLSSIRNGVLVVMALAAVAFGASFAWLHRSAAASSAVGSTTIAQQKAPLVTASGFNGSPAILSKTGPDFVLEVRGVGIVTGREGNSEIWQAIETKANNHATYLSQNPEDYPASDDERLTDLQVATSAAFQFGAGRAVDRWPVPVIVWGPPKDKANRFRAATEIAGSRQDAGLGVTLFLWQDDANTDDGAGMLDKLFQFFDAHPDVPAALVYSFDGSLTRDLLGPPGSGKAPSFEHIIPAIPNSIGVLMVSRSDRVDRLIRPFAVDQTAAINKTNTEYDIIKLWNFYWSESRAFQKEVDRANGGFFNAVVPRADWWQARLPELWGTLGNQGAGQFTPTPYIPVRWTTWQLKQFDNAPLFGYLHRPVDVKLTDDHGRPLKVAQQAEALKAGWASAIATLPGGQEPKRVFYDTTGDRQWVIPLSQALAQTGGTAPNIDEVKEGYDIGARIGNTGVSSPMVQIGLGLIASYDDGGASATVNRRPNGTASIVMVSPPDASVKAAWSQKTKGADPFQLKP